MSQGLRYILFNGLDIVWSKPVDHIGPLYLTEYLIKILLLVPLIALQKWTPRIASYSDRINKNYCQDKLLNCWNNNYHLRTAIFCWGQYSCLVMIKLYLVVCWPGDMLFSNLSKLESLRQNKTNRSTLFPIDLSTNGSQMVKIAYRACHPII